MFQNVLWSRKTVLWSSIKLLVLPDMFCGARNEWKPLFHNKNTLFIMFLDVLYVLSVPSVLFVLTVLLLLPVMFCGFLICFVVPEMT
jgi:hypothetical protein